MTDIRNRDISEKCFCYEVVRYAEKCKLKKEFYDDDGKVKIKYGKCDKSHCILINDLVKYIDENLRDTYKKEVRYWKSKHDKLQEGLEDLDVHEIKMLNTIITNIHAIIRGEN